MTEGNYSNVGHRGPVYKGLGAMNPCDLSIYLLFVLISCSWCDWYAVVDSDSVEIVPGEGSEYL
jgi:hypothetical protein